jgi:hypothetical protein
MTEKQQVALGVGLFFGALFLVQVAWALTDGRTFPGRGGAVERAKDPRSFYTILTLKGAIGLFFLSVAIGAYLDL